MQCDGRRLLEICWTSREEGSLLEALRRWLGPPQRAQTKMPRASASSASCWRFRWSGSPWTELSWRKACVGSQRPSRAMSARLTSLGMR